VGAPDFTLKQSSDDRREMLTIPTSNQYTLQSQVFSEAVRGGKPVQNDIESAVANMRVLDAIVRAAESKRWEQV
jgi:predicted dehydrogenase